MKHLEESLQIACNRWFCMQYPQYRIALHHSPNGGYRNAIEAARFKMMGTRAGFPDFILCLSNKDHNILFIELKTDKGRQTVLQKQYQEESQEWGAKYVVCRSLEEFIDEINNYMKL